MANRFTIGDLEVLVVSDGQAHVPGTVYFPASSSEGWEPHKRWLDHQGNIVMPFGCFLVRTGDRQVLIDTGLGVAKMWNFTGGALLDELAAADVQPDDVDTVFVTHLHVDHCGYVAVPDGDKMRLTFPNAIYRWTSAEHDFWKDKSDLPNQDLDIPGMFEAVSTRFEAADDGAVIAPGINVISLPGHTPGHAGVILSSGDERSFVLGDAISCPVQLEETEWSGLGDIDPELARRSQEVALREAEGDDALVAGAHFPGLAFGRVIRGEGRRYWEAL